MTESSSPRQSDRPTSASHERGSARDAHDVFGDVLPDTTADERDQDGVGPDADPDAWYRAQRPPHHDRS